MSKEETKEVKEETKEETKEEVVEEVTEEKKEPSSDEIIEGLKAELDKAKNVFVIGGNSLVGPLLDADLFDVLIIQIAPVILGKGIPLFTQKEGQRFYQLDEVRQFGPFAELVFSRKSQK